MPTGWTGSTTGPSVSVGRSNMPGNPLSGDWILSFFGMLNTAIGTFYDLNSQRASLKSQELSLRHQQTMSRINARAAEADVFGILEAGQREIGRYTMQAGAEKSRRQAGLAASGVELGTGSAAEIQASGDIIAEIDRYSIEGNIARSAAAARTRQTDILNQGLLAGASAGNMAATRSTINPYTGVATSLLSQAGTLSEEWRYAQRRRV